MLQIVDKIRPIVRRTAVVINFIILPLRGDSISILMDLQIRMSKKN